MSRYRRQSEVGPEGARLALAFGLSLTFWLLLAVFADWHWANELLLAFAAGFTIVYGGVLIIAVLDESG